MACGCCLHVFNCTLLLRAACPQDFQDQEDPGQEGSPEQANPPVDPPENRQQDQVSVDVNALSPSAGRGAGVRLVYSGVVAWDRRI
jgi:hypothetical protein